MANRVGPTNYSVNPTSASWSSILAAGASLGAFMGGFGLFSLSKGGTTGPLIAQAVLGGLAFLGGMYAQDEKASAAFIGAGVGLLGSLFFSMVTKAESTALASESPSLMNRNTTIGTIANRMNGVFQP